MSKLTALILALLALHLRAGASEPPDAQDTFHIRALWEPLMQEKTSEAEIRHEMDRLREQFGKGNRYNRVGFGFIYPAENPVPRPGCNAFMMPPWQITTPAPPTAAAICSLTGGGRLKWKKRAAVTARFSRWPSAVFPKPSATSSLPVRKSQHSKSI